MNALDPTDVARSVINGKIASLCNTRLIAEADAENPIALIEMHDA